MSGVSKLIKQFPVETSSFICGQGWLTEMAEQRKLLFQLPLPPTVT